jgi:hypothetical protein
MAPALSDAGRRFSEVSGEMRRAAQDLHRQLSATRDELKRGVLELPEDARESAESLRRMLSEQIKALGELSEIINRHGQTLDLSGSTAGEQRGSRSDPKISIGESGGAGGNGRNANGRRNGGNAGQAPRVMSRANPRPAPGSVAAQSGSDEGDAKEGWVSDLLRRASDDDDTATRPSAADEDRRGSGTRPGFPALGSVSGDITRAIDHEAAVELWERHSRGERNLFTRRIYTLQGQKTFDEIRRKYQRDQDFRSAVDDYVQDFEKLLAEVTNNGRELAAGNAYLTSDKGKVYTLLAHASGRFD